MRCFVSRHWSKRKETFLVTFSEVNTLYIKGHFLKILTMPQSLTQVYLHIIFSTKNRIPVILPDIEGELYAFIENQCNRNGCIALKVGGCVDHVHILCRLSKHILIPKLLEAIKGSSSKWIKTKYPELNQFYWQDGYAAFSVSPREIAAIEAYIENQRVHHVSKTFKEEYLGFLDKYQVKYDSKYLWD